MTRVENSVHERLVPCRHVCCTEDPRSRALHEEYAKHGRTDQQAPIAATGSVYVDAPPRLVGRDQP